MPVTAAARATLGTPCAAWAAGRGPISRAGTLQCTTSPLTLTLKCTVLGCWAVPALPSQLHPHPTHHRCIAVKTLVSTCTRLTAGSSCATASMTSGPTSFTFAARICGGSCTRGAGGCGEPHASWLATAGRSECSGASTCRAKTVQPGLQPPPNGPSDQHWVLNTRSCPTHLLCHAVPAACRRCRR